ncbi:hypothetical protein KY333_01675 [Candidatus Woesearchaeota archaeon]|nr:hypothetical protein [Candidatus Woesearchaeota archaeon]MBW2994520.1 hypothetical protein [Candidatus Woesearchaeota archaeon]
MSVKKYIIGLALTFAAGLGAGTYVGCTFNKDINYGLAKAERAFAAGSEVLRESYPAPVENVCDTMNTIKTGKNQDEIKDMKKERLEKLDTIINEHE